MSDESWKGCTIQQKSDGGCIILSPDSIPLMETEDAPKTMSKKDNHGNAVDSIRDDEFAKFKLLARCTFLSDGSDNQNNTEANQLRLKDLSQLEKELKGTTVNGKTYVSAAYLGFSMEMKGVVFMRKELWCARNSDNYSQLPLPKPTRGRTSSLEHLIHGPVHEHAARFNLKGVSLRCGLSPSSPTIKHQDVILHYLAMTEANLVMLKRLVSGEPLETFLTTAKGRKAYDLYVDKLIQGLRKGAAIAPFSFINPPVSSDALPGSNSSGSLQADAKPRGDNNRHLSEVTPNPDPATQYVGPEALTGFVYHAAPAGAFEYPPELIRLLKEFALRYPNDFLPLRLMLLACHLWFDIITHPDLQLEWSMLERKRAGKRFNGVSEVSLAAFIVYFAHWLSWTESMGLFEHPHPFRFVSKAYESDQVHAGFAVNAKHIPQDRVIMLMLPSDLSKGISKTFSQISPFWKPITLNNDLEPSHHSPAAPVHSSQQTGTESPAIWPQAPRESLFYAPLLESWSKVPQQAHWAWKHALQLLKDLPKEKRQDETFKALISTAQAQHNQDISLLNECLSSLYTLEDLSDYDLYIAIPTAFGRLIGLPPPQGAVVDAWAEHFLTIEKPSPQVKCISMILGYLRSAKANPSSIPYLRPLIQRTVQQLMGMVDSLEARDWLGSQWDFLFPQFTSTYSTAGDCP
ncbi:hypothetical protein GGI42DRAFT_367787 [Trichoderma sp. SZMC 28013]